MLLDHPIDERLEHLLGHNDAGQTGRRLGRQVSQLQELQCRGGWHLEPIA